MSGAVAAFRAPQPNGANGARRFGIFPRSSEKVTTASTTTAASISTLAPLVTKLNDVRHKGDISPNVSVDADSDLDHFDNSIKLRPTLQSGRRPSPDSPTSVLIEDPAVPYVVPRPSHSSHSASSNSHVSLPTSHSQTILHSDSYAHHSSECPPFHSFPHSRTVEPFRDVSGLITVHRTALFSFITVVLVSLLHFRSFIFPNTGVSSAWSSEWWAQPAWSFLLVLPIMHYAISFVGAMLFHFDTKLDKVRPISTPVVWRIVSRGFNTDCLLETISRCREEMRKNALFPFLIEVVTDGNTFIAPDAPDVVHLKVPPTYKSPNNTMFKARALHYASQYSVIPDEAWVVHLDEETRPTSSGIKGISAFIGGCERNRDYQRIGQGIMLYHRSWRSYPFLTLADMARTGEDIGSFYLQNVIGYPFVGLHGAYVVCRQKEEKSLGFDVGVDGSITEDAWWVFTAAQRGFRLRWVHGYLEEQSTESWLDFLKQRRRWMVGLLKVMRLHPTSLSVRGVFALLMCKWILSPFILPVQMAYILMVITHRIEVPYVITLLSFFNIAMVFYPYLVGWFVNLREGMDVRKKNVAWWTLALIILTPAFQSLELFALILSFFAPWSKSAQGFHVVEKSTTEAKLIEIDPTAQTAQDWARIKNGNEVSGEDNV